MNQRITTLSSPEQEMSERDSLLVAVADFNNHPLDTLKKIHDYNRKHVDAKIILGAGGVEADFIRSCSSLLNELYKTAPKRAKTFYNKLNETLTGSSGKIIFDVWCDVGRLTGGE